MPPVLKTIFRAAPLAAALLATALGLSACGGGGDPALPAPPAADVTLSGVVAVGDPVAGAVVKASCAAAIQRVSSPSSSTGGWTINLPATALPCGLEATGGTVAGAANTLALHSVAAAAGFVAITPLTDLAVARAAGRSPGDWFAGLSTAPTGASVDVRAAASQVLAVLTAAGYVVPAGLDPFVSAFEARVGNVYDDLLESVRAALARTGGSHAQLVANFAAPGATPTVPAATAPVTGGGDTPVNPPPASRQSAPITLVAKGSAGAADIAPLVGTYQGSLGRIYATGQPTVETASCSITVAANGVMTVAAGGKSYAAAVNGDVGDLILHVINLDRIQASDTANDRYVQLTTVRGWLAAGVARQGGTGFTTAADRVECVLPNPAPTNAGTATSPVLMGATAADISASLVGSYSGTGCALTVSNTGVLHFTGGAVDVTTQLGGDETDVVSTFGESVVMQAQDTFAGGTETYIALTYDAGNAALHIAPSYSVDVSRRVPTPPTLLARCSLTKP